jgi:hypothetical protein
MHMVFILLKRVQQYKYLKYYNSRVAQGGHMSQQKMKPVW